MLVQPNYSTKPYMRTINIKYSTPNKYQHVTLEIIDNNVINQISEFKLCLMIVPKRNTLKISNAKEINEISLYNTYVTHINNYDFIAYNDQLLIHSTNTNII